MIVQEGRVAYLDKESQEYVLKQETNPKYKALIELLQGHGLRVSEGLLMQWNYCDFANAMMKVPTLKKRTDELVFRNLAMTDDLIEFLGDWWKESKFKESEDFIFSNHKGDALSRQAVDKRLKRIDRSLSAHKFRHTFATNMLSEGRTLDEIGTLLDHKSTKTTMIYAHLNKDRIKEIMRPKPKGFFPVLKSKLFPKKRIHVIPVKFGDTNFHVGRKAELEKLAELTEKRINVLLTGAFQTGKSHLLNNFEPKNCFRFDEIGSPKKAVGGMLLKLASDNYETGERQKFLSPGEEFSSKGSVMALVAGKAIDRKFVQVENITTLVDLLIQVTKKKEYTILIDDVTRITASQVKLLERLKNHFHVICGARRVKISNGTFLSNFDRVELKNLSRAESNELTDLVCKKFKAMIEDFESLKNHVYEQTNGNPGAIYEMCERYRAEGYVTAELTKDVRHTQALNEIDMAIPLLIFFSGLMVLRYIGGEVGADKGAYKLIGGIFMVVALFGRYFLTLTKRRFV